MPLRHRALVRGRRAALAITAVGSLLALAAPNLAVAAPANPGGPAKVTATPRAGAAQSSLTPARRAALIESARSMAAGTARRIGLGAEERLVVKDVIKDADGTLHTRYERTYAGLPVLGGDLVVHDKSGKGGKGGRTTVTKANPFRLAVPSLTPKVTAAGAAAKALGASKQAEVKGSATERAPRLVIWAGSGRPVLAWETVVKGVQQDGTPSELQVVTDAASGKQLQAAEQVHTDGTGARTGTRTGTSSGTGTGQYVGEVPLGTTLSGSSYQLVDPDRAGQKTYDLNQGSSGTGTLFTDDNDVWGNGLPSNRQTAGVDVAFGAAATWDYYKEMYGRNGIRNDGVAAYSRAHYGNNYVNAFWQDTCFCMTYGDGKGNTHPLTALDVAAHEMTHGVTAATARLNYSGESGGLNEATSDIFAAAVEFHENLPADPGDYLVGEKIDINGNGTPLRYMDKPSKDGKSRDSWSPGVGSIDVHYSSGPANHFFYLLSEGSGARTVNGVNYDSPTADGRPVTGIGIENAAAIWYRALTTYMVSTTNYAGARTATLSAAADLFGAYSPTYLAVADAWAAINVGHRLAIGVNLVPTADQISGVSQDVSLQLDAYTTNTGAALTYEATGLPDGLTLSPTGLISGTATTLGTSDVTVKVTDSTGSTVSDTFSWQIGNVYTNNTYLDIPDRGPAVESPVTINGREGNASATTSVYVHIIHPWRGDLAVDLVGPNGTVYSLLKRSGDWNENIDQTFTVDASAQPIKGTWKLRMQDQLTLFSGYLVGWRLTP
ncbi:M4 family metallopeptidase [Streptomyces graminilatus]|uniref:M4 family metallopeptidase n=1 Tax=Streptomyces graminilatus TaxID=1464070 RepID=UPI0006E36E63|nr:M4 family metallopeptidase [Streptomyces graminilatus]